MIDEFYLYVDQLGLNTTKIYLAMAFFLLLLVFGIREIFAWFLKTHAISKQFTKISSRLESIETKLDQMAQVSSEDPQVLTSISPNKNQFEINH